MKKIKTIAFLLTKIKHLKTMEALLTELLTKKEIENIALRLELLKKLKKGDSQRKISKSLKISLCKITRGSKILKNPNSILKSIIQSNND